jgi:hypothetical protein
MKMGERKPRLSGRSRGRGRGSGGSRSRQAAKTMNSLHSNQHHKLFATPVTAIFDDMVRLLEE